MRPSGVYRDPGSSAERFDECANARPFLSRRLRAARAIEAASPASAGTMPQRHDLPPHPIDAVITWVDGDDPRHRAKRLQWAPEVGTAARQMATERFRCLGEVGYCVRSILRFAPFIRRIHIVTDDQVPATITESAAWPAEVRGMLSVVDHRDIFAGHQDVLPTFNSRAIETMLHRIPGLAEQFVYLNDDVMLIKPVRPDDWFHESGPVLRGCWQTQPHRLPSRRIRAAYRRLFGIEVQRPSPSFNAGQARAAGILGHENRYFAADHHPHPLRRSTFERFFAAHPDILRENIRHRVRHASQYNPVALAGHLELAAGTARVTRETRLARVSQRTRPRSIPGRLRRAEHDPRTLFVNVQSLGSADEATRSIVIEWLDRVIGRDLVMADVPPAAHPGPAGS